MWERGEDHASGGEFVVDSRAGLMARDPGICGILREFFGEDRDVGTPPGPRQQQKALQRQAWQGDPCRLFGKRFLKKDSVRRYWLAVFALKNLGDPRDAHWDQEKAVATEVGQL